MSLIEARQTFTSNFLWRDRIVSGLHKFLATKIGLEYEIRELRRGFIHSDFVIILKHRDKKTLVDITDVITYNFRKWQEEDQEFIDKKLKDL